MQLYLDFAEPFEMLEIILLILHTSDHRDPALVSKTWRAILERSESRRLSFFQNSSADPSFSFPFSDLSSADSEAATDADKPDALAAVVVSLGRRFFPSETAFPLGAFLLFLPASLLPRSLELTSISCFTSLVFFVFTEFVTRRLE